MVMATNVGEGLEPSRTRVPGREWSLLYRIGGVSAFVFVGMLLAAVVLFVVNPAPPADGGAATLRYIAAHRTPYVVQQQLWLVPGVFAMVTYVALYPALRGVSMSLALLGSAVGAVAWAVTLAIPTTTTGAPALVYLSDQYASAADPSRRLALATAAETLVAQNRTTSVVGPLTAAGMLIVSLAMLHGVFPRFVALLGIVTGGLGIAAEVLRMVFEGFYGIYGILLPVWMGAVGWNLYRLGRHRGRVPDPGGGPDPGRVSSTARRDAP
ncbi:DUF4386 domain-containing protein [Pedococcus sp. KACC 23699]|uniref:DUF4386 domain-containing protein n=1 Tax=Pedococcus sp. KACC 23699 TaxID=3149228 RepID=A0AAU7JT10_9MICO